MSRTTRSFSRRAVMWTLGACLLATAAAPWTAHAEEGGKKKIVFIAGKPSHEFGGHEHRAGSMLLAKWVGEAMGDKVVTKVYTGGWPSEPDALAGADAVIMYCDGGNGHMALPHLKELDALAEKGVGIGCIHYGVEPGDGKVEPSGRPEFLKWIGGYFEAFYSVNPHWKADVTALPKHPVANGVKPFTTNDEWYYHMRFREGMQGVTPIIAAVPPDSTRQGKDNAHGGNPEVRSGIGKSLPEVTVWVAEQPNGMRGFGCTGGHVHWNWAQDDFRKTILNAIVWAAHLDVPPNGVESKRPTVEELLANMDAKKRPPEKSDEWIAKQIESLNAPKAAASTN